jgi:hypothetical protein
LGYSVLLLRHEEHQQSTDVGTRFLKNRVFSEECARGYWDAKFGEAWQEDFEWYRVGCGLSLPHSCQLTIMVEFPTNSIRFVGIVS